MHFARLRFRLFALLLVTGGAAIAQTPAPAPLAPIENEPALTPLAPVVEPAAGTPLAGSNSVTAALTHGEALVASALEAAYQAQTGSQAAGVAGSFGYYIEQYRHFNSTPFLYVVGLPVGTLLETIYFKQTIWALAVLFVAASVASKMRSARGDFLDFYSNLMIKIMVGGMLLSQSELIYATTSVVMNSGALGVKTLAEAARKQADGAGKRIYEVLNYAGTSSIELREARDRGIRAGLVSRQAVFTLYAKDPALDSAALDYWATFFNGLAVSQKANFPTLRNYDPLPRVGQSAMDDVRRKVVARYSDLTFDSANITSAYSLVNPAAATRASFTLNWEFGEHKSTRTQFSVRPLSNMIETYAGAVAEAYKKTDTSPKGQQQKIELLDQYEKGVRDATSTWIADEYLGNFNATMDGAGRLAGAFADLRTVAGRGALAATNAAKIDTWATWIAKGLGAGVSLLQTTLLPLIGTIAPFVLNLFLELSLLGLLIATPFWFFEGTQKAFTGALETMCACCLMLPFWHFFQLLLDLLFGTFTYLIANVALVGGTAAAFSGVGLPALGVATAILVGALTIGYGIASIVLAFKTPSLVKAFLSGAGWVTGVLMTGAKGMIASAAVAGIGAVAAGSAAAGVSGMAGAGAGAGSTARSIASGATTAFRASRPAIRAMGRAGLDVLVNDGNATPAITNYYERSRRDAAARAGAPSATPESPSPTAAGSPGRGRP
jgi:hypothetical protein